MYKTLYGYIFVFVLGKYLGVELLDHVLIVYKKLPNCFLTDHKHLFLLITCFADTL